MATEDRFGAARRFPKEYAEELSNGTMLDIMLEKMARDLVDRALVELEKGERICKLSSVTKTSLPEEIEFRQMVTITDLVRCGDCMYWDRLEPGHPYGYCHAAKHGYGSANWDISIYRKQKEDFFCADGDRKESKS